MARLGDIKESTEETIKVTVNDSTKNEHEVSDYNNYGIDSQPEKGAKAILLSLREKAHKILVGIKRKVTDRKAKPGETRLYSASGSEVYLNEDGEIVIQTSGGAIITMKSTGNIEINGNTKSAMTFEEFKLVWDAFIVAFEAHVHLGNLGSPTGSPTVPLTSGQKDMTPAKSLKIKLGANA